MISPTRRVRRVECTPIFKNKYFSSVEMKVSDFSHIRAQKRICISRYFGFPFCRSKWLHRSCVYGVAKYCNFLFANAPKSHGRVYPPPPTPKEKWCKSDMDMKKLRLNFSFRVTWQKHRECSCWDICLEVSPSIRLRLQHSRGNPL